MLQFLSPLGLFALAALAIPAVIHLWRPPARIVRVGTLLFFGGPAVRRLTKLRWRERLLLAVRLALLTLLVFLLARAAWRNDPPAGPQRWALREPEAVLSGDAAKRWSELDAAGYEMRLLVPGFPRATISRSNAAAQSAAADIWSLLREVDARLPAGSKVAVFSHDRIVSLRGERPATSKIEVEWVSAYQEGTSRTWLQSVNLLPRQENAPRNLRMVIRTSDERRTDSIVSVLPAVHGKAAISEQLQDWSVEIAQAPNDGFSARLLHSGSNVVTGGWVHTPPAHPVAVAIMASAGRDEDAKCIEAAVRAISEVSGHAVTISNSDAAAVDWIFWLNDAPPPEQLLEQVRNRGISMLSDAEDSNDAEAVVTSTVAGVLPSAVGVFRRTAGDASAAVWTDGFGAPLLTVTREGGGERYRFFSRFHPEWTDLPRSSALAAALQPLLLAAADSVESANGAPDQRRIDTNQARPAERGEQQRQTDVSVTASPDIIDLHQLLWIISVALFAIERALSHIKPAAAQQLANQPERERALAEHA